MNRILVIITTYNRDSMLNRLINQISKESLGYELNVRIYDDASLAQSFIKKPSNLTQITYTRFPEHRGKELYWKTWDEIMNDIRNIVYDYAITLPDDVELVPGFFNRAIDQYCKISNPNKIVLNLLKCNRTGPCWNGHLPRPEGEVMLTQWFDLCGIMTKKFFNVLNYTINPVPVERWEKDFKLGSGVGAQITKRLNQFEFNMYQVTDTLVIHADHESMMNPEERRLNPIVSKKKWRVFASMATIPERKDQLKLTVESIIDQVDILAVNLNGHKIIPAFLKNNEKILWRLFPKDYNLGDAQKFYPCSMITDYDYCFTIDDDLIYPPDYVSETIRQMLEHNNQALITYHGRIMIPGRIKSYYKDHLWKHNCLIGSQEFNQQIDVPGSGVSCWCPSLLKVDFDNIKTANMGDIWLAKFCREQGVPVILGAHRAGWFQYMDSPANIYTRYLLYDSVQTELWNSITGNQ